MKVNPWHLGDSARHSLSSAKMAHCSSLNRPALLLPLFWSQRAFSRTPHSPLPSFPSSVPFSQAWLCSWTPGTVSPLPCPMHTLTGPTRSLTCMGCYCPDGMATEAFSQSGLQDPMRCQREVGELASRLPGRSVSVAPSPRPRGKSVPHRLHQGTKGPSHPSERLACLGNLSALRQTEPPSGQKKGMGRMSYLHKTSLVLLSLATLALQMRI